MSCFFAIAAPSFAQNVSQPDIAFRSARQQISVRYPAGWEVREPQLPSTILLLYANDGSGATCNLNARPLANLDSLSELQVETLRRQNHDRQFVEQALSRAFVGLEIVSYRRSHFGQLSAGVAEYRHELRVNDGRIIVHAVMTATLANGQRYTLSCNAPPAKFGAAQAAFDHIRSTAVFR